MKAELWREAKVQWARTFVKEEYVVDGIERIRFVWRVGRFRRKLQVNDFPVNGPGWYTAGLETRKKVEVEVLSFYYSGKTGPRPL